ncbi:MAG TPA: cation:dicarboxylase symporter family transporter [Sphingobium sp.]
MFLALIVGLVGGVALGNMQMPGFATTLVIAQSVGKLWLDALSMTVVPLIFGLLVTGILTAARVGSASLIGWRALIWFTLLLTIACLLAAMATTLLLSWWPVSPIAVGGSDGLAPALPPATGWLQAISPMNPVRAAAETAIVPLVLFAMLFGFAAARIEGVLGEAILTFFRAVVETMLVIVRWILAIAPIGVAALAFAAGAKMGTAAVGTLIQYIIVIATICLLTTLMAYVVVGFAGGISLPRFARSAAPAQAIAFGTQSSLASLPVMIQAAPGLDVTPTAAGIILPLAVSLFRAASAAANVAVAIYLAHLHGIALPWPTLLLGAMVAVPVSLAAVGLPAQVSFFATIGPVCLAMGIPIEALPLLLAVESVPDLFRTVGNVTADLAVARLAGRGAG